MIASLRHLRLVLAIAQQRSFTRAAQAAHLSQPAVTSAIAGIEARLGVALFDRDRDGTVLTPAGAALCLRIQRALNHLDPALHLLSARLVLTTSLAQVQALIAVTECENYSAAARQLGLAQPSVHRAISTLEQAAGQKLFTRSEQGQVPSRAMRQLAQAARLALAELEQAETDVADVLGREVGRIVIGAMPLSRMVLLGPAIAQFRAMGRTMPVRIIEGPYSELTLGLRRGQIDFLIGALRADADDLTQEVLFHDDLAIVARNGHPALTAPITPVALAALPWVVSPQGSPARRGFDDMFARAGLAVPVCLVETGSMVLLRDLVMRSDHFGFVSLRQANLDIARGDLVRAQFDLPKSPRPIGLTMRQGWHPTRAGGDMLKAIRNAALYLGRP